MNETQDQLQGRKTPQIGDTCGWIHGGGPQWGVCVSTDEGLLVRTEERDFQLRSDEIAVISSSPLKVVQAAAQHYAESQDIPSLWQTTLAKGDALFTPLQVAEILQVAGDDLPGLWLALWQHPEYFARHGRVHFRTRTEEEVSQEKERILQKVEEQKVVQQLGEENAQWKSGALTLSQWMEQRQEVAQVVKSCAFGEASSVDGRVDELIRGYLDQAYQRAQLRWPQSWFLGQELGLEHPWQEAHPLLAAHLRTLKAWPAEEVVIPQGEVLKQQTQLWAIDDAATSDRDDAVGWTRLDDDTLLIEIAIADLTAGVGAQDTIVRQVTKIATSVYLPGKTIPLLPPHLGSAVHSLDEGTTRPVFLLRCRVHLRTGKVVASPKLERGFVNIFGNTSYAAIDAGEVALDAWSELETFAEAQAGLRSKMGADRIENPEAVVEVKNGHPVQLHRTEPWKGARAVIREIMILANWSFGSILADAELPAPFRVQERSRRDFSPTTVSCSPGPHYGIGVDVYVFATSPIRRAIDMLAQRQLLSLFGGTPMSTAQVEELAASAEASMQEMKRWMRGADRYWKLRYLEAEPKTKLWGTVERFGEDRAFVRVAPVELIVPMPKTKAQLGARKLLQLDEIDAERGRIALSWV